MARPQAWWVQAGRHCRSDQWRDMAYLAQDTSWDRHANAGGSGRGDHREPHRPLSADCPAIACRAMDAPVLPDLPNQIPTNEVIGSVTADGVNDTRKYHDAIATAGRMPSSHHAKTPSRVRPSLRVRRPETSPCELRNTSDGRSGETGADTRTCCLCADRSTSAARETPLLSRRCGRLRRYRRCPTTMRAWIYRGAAPSRMIVAGWGIADQGPNISHWSVAGNRDFRAALR